MGVGCVINGLWEEVSVFAKQDGRAGAHVLGGVLFPRNFMRGVLWWAARKMRDGRMA
jgi:hypothetical protein